MTSDKPYVVLFWCSHPDEENDDCACGENFSSREEALSAFRNPENFFHSSCFAGVAYVEVDGPHLYEVRRLISEEEEAQLKRTRSLEDDSWRREIAMEAGMLGGCSAYNDLMGWDVE